MPAEKLLKALADLDEGLLLMEPRSAFDKCVVGVVERFNDRFVVYDRECVLNEMADGMEADPDEDPMDLAIEYYRFNTLGAWVGETTPGYLLKNPEEL